MRGRDLSQVQRREDREAEVQDARPEAVLARRAVLLEIPERRERGDVAMRCAAGEGKPARQFTDPERRTVRGERPEDGEAALEGLRESSGISFVHVPNIRTLY